MTIITTTSNDINISVQEPGSDLSVSVSVLGSNQINITQPGYASSGLSTLTNEGSGLGWVIGVAASNGSFKSILAGAGITLEDNGTEITVSTTGGGTIYSGTTFPSPANSGDIFYNESDGQPYIYSGSVWELVVLASNLSDGGSSLITNGGTF